jgi:hypothetical protein
MIGVYTSLANYILHLGGGALMYFSSHMLSHVVIMWFKTEGIKIASN